MAEIAGLKLITPTSVAGTGVSLSGAKVVFTAATSINVNGVFSSTYDNYLLKIRASLSLAADPFYLRLRASGSDATASNYTWQQIDVSGSSVTGVRQTVVSTGSLTRISDDSPAGIAVFMYGPYLAQPTAYRSVSAATISGAYIGDYANTHSLSTSYDGFTCYVGGENTTGTITVYGLLQ